MLLHVMLDHGSFTGIRIGISSVKAIAESLNIPVIDVSSLETLAYNIENINCKIICSLIDARNNQVYCGIFDKIFLKNIFLQLSSFFFEIQILLLHTLYDPNSLLVFF